MEKLRVWVWMCVRREEVGKERIPSGSLQRRSHMAPSCGTSCFRSSSRIMSTVSTRGLNPPCTQRTAPPDVAFDEPPASPVAPEPGGPVLFGVVFDCAGGDAGGDGDAAGPVIDVMLRFLRMSRVMSSPAELSISISISSSSPGEVLSLLGSARIGGLVSGCTLLAAPMMSAPRAR